VDAYQNKAQSYMFKDRLLKCEPIDLNCFVMDLREALGILGTLF